MYGTWSHEERPFEVIYNSLPFQGTKSLDFHGPPLPLALIMDVTRIKSIRPLP
jgi:hypothetical protein